MIGWLLYIDPGVVSGLGACAVPMFRGGFVAGCAKQGEAPTDRIIAEISRA